MTHAEREAAEAAASYMLSAFEDGLTMDSGTIADAVRHALGARALAQTPPPDEEAPVAWAVVDRHGKVYFAEHRQNEAEREVRRNNGMSPTDTWEALKPFRVVPLYARHPAAKGEGAV